MAHHSFRNADGSWTHSYLTQTQENVYAGGDLLVRHFSETGPVTQIRAVMSVVLGALSGPFCWAIFPGPLALILGIITLVKYDPARAKPINRPLAIIGIVLGAGGTLLTLFALATLVIWLVDGSASQLVS